MRIEELERNHGARNVLKNRVALYLRKSREDQEKEKLGAEETLRMHETILMEVVDRMDLHVVEVYREVVSGESIDSRPEMQRLLRDLYENKYDGVLVVELERLARGATMDQGRVANAFKYTDTKIITPSKVLDPNNEHDEEWLEFSLFMSRREFKTINRRMATGKIQAVKEGNYMGTMAPFGYDAVKKGRRNRILVPNENAKYVQMIFDWYTEEDVAIGEIGRRITRLGVPTLRGGREWTARTIAQILKNQHYIGMVHWGKRPVERVYDGMTLRKTAPLKPEEEQLIVPGRHEPIISPAQFEKAQQLRLIRRPSLNQSLEIRSPFATLLKCGKCGISMRHQRYMNRKSEVDRIAHRTAVNCKTKTAQMRIVYEAMLQGLESHIEDFKFKLTNDANLAEAKRIETEKKMIEKEIAKQTALKKKIFTYLEDETYTKAEFLERKSEIVQKLHELETALEELSSKTVDVDYQELIVTFTDIMEKLRDDSVSPKIKNDLLRSIIKRIDYWHTEDEGIVLDIILR